MQLRSVRIENFRCLKSVDLELEPLTVLVGPNGAGKSALIDALQPDFQTDKANRWRRDPAATPVRRGKDVHGNAFDSQRSPKGVWSFLRLHLSPRDLRQTNQVRQETTLTADGSNLANVLASLPRKRQQEIAEHLAKLVPLYQDVDVRPAPSHGYHRIVFQDRWDQDVWYEPDEVSDGTILLVAFLTLSHMSMPPDLLAIEEPEHALHPYLLGQVVSILRDLATGKLGPKPIQVILATHSAELLDFVEPQEVRFLSRDLAEGHTIIRRAPVDTEQWRAAYETYDQSLGEIWLSGGLGGVTGTPAPS